MRRLMAVVALLALAACGVDGAPIRPGAESQVRPGKNAAPAPDTDGWISGTMSQHAAATL